MRLKKLAIQLEADIENYKIKAAAPALIDYIRQYIDTDRKGVVSAASLEIDEYCLKRIEQFYNHRITVDKVTGTMHQQYINDLFSKNYSMSTIKKTNSLMYRAMERAKFDGFITHNPAELIEYKMIDKAKKAEYIPKEKIKPFLADVKRRNIYHYFLFRLIIETGLRIGEACGLTYSDIDRNNLMLHVTKSYDQKRKKLGPTKTKHHRDIFISQSLMEELDKLFQIHKTNQINYNDSYHNVYNFIFVDPLGRPLSRSSIHNTMMYCSEKVLGKDNKMSVHKLRHTHATLLLESNVPMKVIQDRLGHQSMEMTERVYAHVTPTLKESTRKIFEDHLKDLF